MRPRRGDWGSEFDFADKSGHFGTNRTHPGRRNGWGVSSDSGGWNLFLRTNPDKSGTFRSAERLGSLVGLGGLEFDFADKSGQIGHIQVGGTAGESRRTRGAGICFCGQIRTNRAHSGRRNGWGVSSDSGGWNLILRTNPDKSGTFRSAERLGSLVGLGGLEFVFADKSGQIGHIQVGGTARGVIESRGDWRWLGLSAFFEVPSRLASVAVSDFPRLLF